MKRTIKLRPQEVDLPERKVRLQLPGRLTAELEDYCKLYAQAHGQEIELPALIEAILEQFLASDRGFQRARKGSAQSTRSASAPSSAEDRS